MTDKPLPNHGYSIPDPHERALWRDLVVGIRQRISEGNFEETVLFHGTSERALERILLDGMEPVECSHALPPDCRDDCEYGSFWGNIDTAATYADDTAAERHPDSLPVIIAIRVSTLENDYRIVPDGATVDFPLKGLTRLDDPEVAAYWSDFGLDRHWPESLRDLGAVVAIHDFTIPIEDMVVIRSMDDFERLFEVRADIRPGPATVCP
ncbi:hypothetical protein OIU34_20170 [Pararhizobium sp. BT-229]|uniref:hypothetical protein n=1 Tax=Pararhizobium sp. BT-229 TaxID=2986923 RepID=UPI0021F7BFCF|nr:hypothetical protein [Pararhizobium sp. BT-229]MCV9964204.1 hypothetical protein [Pararhizobium sp. BT-229]